MKKNKEGEKRKRKKKGKMKKKKKRGNGGGRPNTSIEQQAHSLVKIYTMVKTVYIKNELVFIKHTYEDNNKKVI
jgi:hypothetical protein